MDFTPRNSPHWRAADDGMRLIGTRQGAAGPVQFPPAPGAHRNEQLEDVELGPTGSIYSFTTIHLGQNKPSYRVAMVDFSQGARVFGRLVDNGPAPYFGGRVRVVPFAMADGTADYAFETLEQP